MSFDHDVHVTGAPAVTLSIGASSRAAEFQSGSGTARLLFRYVVVEDDRDDDGISIGANAMTGGVIEDASGRPVDRSFGAVGALADHRVGPATETVVRMAVPSLSPGQPWHTDLADILGQVGVSGPGALAASSAGADIARAEVVGTRLSLVAVAEGVTTVVVTASRARLRILLEVTVRTDPAERAVVEEAFATLGRGLLLNAVDTIGTRLEQANGDLPAGGGERWPAQDDEPLPGGPLFAQPDAAEAGLGPDGAALHPGGPSVGVGPSAGVAPRPDISFAFPLGEARPGRLSWGAWGAGDYRSFEGESDAGSYDGDLASAYLGVDVSGENWVVGVAASRSQAEIDYEFAGAVRGDGILDVELDSFYPYAQWSPGERVSLMGMLGFGSGEVRPERDGRAVGLAADLSMGMGAAGVRVELGRQLGMDLAVRGDAGFLQLETDAGIGPAHAMTVGVHHARVGVIGSWSYHLGEGLLTPFVEASGRFDGGDGPGGGGLEVAGGVRYRGPMLGLELKGRTVALHGAQGYSEHGLSGLIVVGRQGEAGWNLALAPRWGGAADAMDLAWRGDYRGIGGAGPRPSWGFAGRLSRGWLLQRGAGLVTPFGEFDVTHRDRRRARIGLGYRLEATPSQPPVFLELVGERVRIDLDDSDHRIVLTGRAVF